MAGSFIAFVHYIYTRAVLYYMGQIEAHMRTGGPYVYVCMYVCISRIHCLAVIYSIHSSIMLYATAELV